MDPFEARLQFQQMLKTITSSNNNNLQIAKFALQQASLQEDFHQCILERITKTLDFNHKVNLYQLLAVLIGESQRLQQEKKPYVVNIVKDLELIVRKVLTGADGETLSLVNMNSCFPITLQISRLLDFKEVHQYQESIKNINPSPEAVSIPVWDTITADKDEILTRVWELLVSLKQMSKNKRFADVETAAEVEDNQIKTVMRRMEDDRERTKKLKETLWQNHSQNPRQEFEEISKNYQTADRYMGEDAFKDMVEVNITVSQCYNDWTKK